MYIVIETHGGPQYCTIYVNEGNGEPKIFDEKQEAEEYAFSQCQDGIVVEV